MRVVAQVCDPKGTAANLGGVSINVRLGIVVVAIGELFLGGCTSKPTGPALIPVHGVVTLNGKLLTTGGSVSFRDGSGLVQPCGEIGADGNYKLFLSPLQEGAPPGKYKVVVFASEPREEAAKHNRLPVIIVNRKYMDTKTTPLAAEVKKDASPGAYDFSVTN